MIQVQFILFLKKYNSYNLMKYTYEMILKINWQFLDLENTVSFFILFFEEDENRITI